MVTKQEAPSQALETPSLYSDEEIKGLQTFGDAVDLANSKGGITDGKDLGIGLDVVEKDTLVGVEMILLEWRFNVGDFGPFVSVTAMTKDNRKLVFNDGSTGIYAQLTEITDAGKASNIYLRKGLRKSTYDNPQGEGKSTTFYLAI
jgi:hypothetical protein